MGDSCAASMLAVVTEAHKVRTFIVRNNSDAMQCQFMNAKCAGCKGGTDPVRTFAVQEQEPTPAMHLLPAPNRGGVAFASVRLSLFFVNPCFRLHCRFEG